MNKVILMTLATAALLQAGQLSIAKCKVPLMFTRSCHSGVIISPKISSYMLRGSTKDIWELKKAAWALMMQMCNNQCGARVICGGHAIMSEQNADFATNRAIFFPERKHIVQIVKISHMVNGHLYWVAFGLQKRGNQLTVLYSLTQVDRAENCFPSQNYPSNISMPYNYGQGGGISSETCGQNYSTNY